MNIALLEDNPSILDYLSTALEMVGHRVHTFIESPSLYEALFEEGSPRSPLPFDVLLVDLLLPGDISGLEAIRTIREDPSTRHLPIIIVSACSQSELEEVHKEFSDIPILRKPFKTQALLEQIEAVAPAG
jgi:CheY-like chemotaxis protein